MKLKKQSRIVTIAALSLSLAGLLAGCELIVDFDRTKIDGGTVEGGGDVVQPDGSMPDTGTDGTVDTGVDTGTDGTVQDTGTDGTVQDTGTDVQSDTSPD